MSSVGSAANPFVERLQAHAAALRTRPRLALVQPDDTPAARAEERSFWQSSEAYFAERYGAAVPLPDALSLRSSDARLEAALVRGAGACERVAGLESDAERAQRANAGVPGSLREQIRYQEGSILEWASAEPLGAVIARNALHRQHELDAVLDRIERLLAPGGLVFVDEFVGPARFQWTDAQLEAINRLLACLPEELLVEVGGGKGQHKRTVARPQRASHAAANPDDAVCSDRIIAGLDARFERVEVQLYGGALYHQLFTRIMGNFNTRPELVRVLMELDALLTDRGALSSDYVWGVWRRPSRPEFGRLARRWLRARRR
jgi:SAM-dependent methyltransferase